VFKHTLTGWRGARQNEIKDASILIMWTLVVLAAQVFNNDSHIVNTKLAKRKSYSYLMNFLLSIQPFDL